MDVPELEAIAVARLVNQVTDYAIVALDLSGTIESWNAGAEQLKGYSAEEALGRNFSMFYTPEDRADQLPMSLLRRARDEGRVQHTGWRVRKDGSRFWGDVVITSIKDESGAVSGFGKVVRDRTVEHQLEQSLRRSEERFRLLVDQVVDYAIIAMDQSGTIESWNAGAERLKGYTRDQAIGRHFSIFYTPEDRREGLPLQLLHSARVNGSVEHTGWRVRRNGSTMWANVIITALHDEDSRLRGYAKVTRDLTARKRFEEARSRFFDTFAHDFRTPVSAMSGFAYLLGAARTDDERTRFITQIEANAKRLVTMTENLIGLTRMRAGDSEPAIEELDVADLLDATIASLSSVLDVERVATAVPPLRIQADREAMQRVLTNLLQNALLYSSSPTAVTVTAEPAGDRVRLLVSDQGRGIDPHDLPRIFDEFERGRLAENDDAGTGLGLASVRDLVTAQKGRVEIESTPGVGTLVTVELPAASTEHA